MSAIRNLLKVMAWLWLLVIVLVSLSPPNYRPITDVPHSVEHLGVFLATGLTFGLAYPKRYLSQLTALVLFAASVEVTQLWVPGRHARLSDFFLNALGLAIGIGSSLLITRNVISSRGVRRTAIKELSDRDMPAASLDEGSARKLSASRHQP